jgi:hypothetical protein
MPTLLEFPLDATSGLELRIAHRRQTAGCDTVRFPNQALLPALVELHAYIRGNEFVAARLAGPDKDGYFSVEVELRETAARKIDRLAKRQEPIGLGVFRRGQAIQLIQAVRGISGRNLAWYGFEDEQKARAVLAMFGAVQMFREEHDNPRFLCQRAAGEPARRVCCRGPPAQVGRSCHCQGLSDFPITGRSAEYRR